MTAAALRISKRKKVIAEGVLRAELDDFFGKILREDGYSGLALRVTPIRTEIIIMATRTREVVGEHGLRVRQLTALVQHRFGYKPNQVEILVEPVENRGLCAMAQAESIRFKLLKGLPVRRAANAVLRTVMESGAKGCEVVVSGKIRVLRAKTMKFRDGYMIASGQPKVDYITKAIRMVKMRLGVLGIKVKIMLDYDPSGVNGPNKPLPDQVHIQERKQISDISVQPTIRVYNKEAQKPAENAEQEVPAES